ncbi:uncharacterized protein MONOS_1631 [Monocercomonoides exilis]|uniref:uncharacterized protein n=1 Tax=Monocercomonoides exilis TaxID=2049356 RepID=UPI00355AA766|nr:hypothetical protein MONOS_1631 [Monocercomonoides exilis]|eukprot:MONOS_1631.1-p1 / transcript=MONOS_1631.1 / gene=MONOS_1631 / organism=Monocercomonoides_exilis_PA203 / gene_product=unspecified product / transcript_product=unspecified product / location=Mono_scaffold00030:562-1311(-) / protein_length=171 / sequence_SO=supercontig / SO=protein_coding / is_pseudo=false
MIFCQMNKIHLPSLSSRVNLRTIVLISSDKKRIVVPYIVAKKSKALRRMMKIFPTKITFYFPGFESKIIDKVMSFCAYHSSLSKKDLMFKQKIQKYHATYVALKFEILIKVAALANILEIQPLLELMGWAIQRKLCRRNSDMDLLFVGKSLENYNKKVPEPNFEDNFLQLT